MSKMTQQGYEKLQQELEQLETKDQPIVAKLLKEAIAQGDLSENFAYHDAKDRQAELEERIAFLKDEIKQAEVEESPSLDEVTVGNTIVLQKEDNTTATYTITGNQEADPTQNKISYDSPIGVAVLNKQVGEQVEVETPGGVKKYTILKIN